MHSPTPQSAYAPINGLHLYHEIYGAGGTPLVLLHGGFGVIGMFAALLPALAKNRQVIGVELQGHGHTADTDRPFSFQQMADDIAALLQYLGIARADVMGYSFGGEVALQTAMRHPEMVRKLVVVSATYQQAGWYPEVLAGMASLRAETADQMVGTPMYDAYMRTAPKPDEWPRLVGKMGEFMSQDYDWTDAVAALEPPTLIVVADGDSVRLDHAVSMFGLLGGGKADGAMGEGPGSEGNELAHQFAVLPGTLHWNILFHPELLLPVVLPFLDTPAAPLAATRNPH